MTGINQIQVHPKIGLTFANSLRSILRHDPDIVLVGEIRDLETAENAIQASLTGHLVFSTLHTNDAAGAYTRLVDMGVEPFLVSSTVEAVMAQRLVRTLCTDCKQAVPPEPGRAARGFPRGRTRSSTTRLPAGRAAGSAATSAIAAGSGMFELLVTTEHDPPAGARPGQHLGNQARPPSSKACARSAQDGWIKVLGGTTTRRRSGPRHQGRPGPGRNCRSLPDGIATRKRRGRRSTRGPRKPRTV